MSQFKLATRSEYFFQNCSISRNVVLFKSIAIKKTRERCVMINN